MRGFGGPRLWVPHVQRGFGGPRLWGPHVQRRTLLIVGLAGALLLGAAAPGDLPERPVKFIAVDQLKAELDRGVKIDVIDVRGWDQYVDLHIKGARSMPLRTVEARAPREISRTGRVVFY